MGEGLIQLLVVAAFVIISMMDAASRRRRKEAQRLGHLPTRDGFPEAADDLDEVSDSSEGLVLEDVWQEIASLARGEVPASRREELETPDRSAMDDPASELEAWTAPGQDVEAKTRSADLQAGYSHPDQAASHAEHAHEGHAEVAFPPPLLEELQPEELQPEELPHEELPHEELPHEELPHEFVPHPREQPSEPQQEPRLAQPGRSLLRGVRRGAKGSLREAIILAEVLSPPVTLRDSGWKPTF